MFRLILLVIFFNASSLAMAQLILGKKNRNIQDIAIRDSVLCAVTENTIELWDINSNMLIKAIEYSNHDIISALSFGHQHTEIVTGSRGGELAIWDIKTGEKNVLMTAGNLGAITALNYFSEVIAVGFSNKTSLVYNLTTRSEVSRVDSYSMDVTTIKFMNDANILLSGSGNGEVIYQNFKTHNKGILFNYSKWIRDFALNADGSKLAVGYDKGISVLKVKDKLHEALEIERFKVTDWISSLDYHPSDDCLVYSTLSGKVYIKTRNGNYIKKLDKNVMRVLFVPRPNNYLRLAIATRGNGLIILDAINMKFVD